MCLAVKPPPHQGRGGAIAGPRFSYNEYLYHATAGAAKAAKRSIVNSIAALENPFTRALLRLFLPKPGQGDLPAASPHFGIYNVV